MKNAQKVGSLAIALLTVTMISACSSGGSDSSDEPSEDAMDAMDTGDVGDAGDAMNNSPMPGINDSAVSGVFDGQYFLVCLPNTNLTSMVTVTADSFVQQSTFYEDAACTQPTTELLTMYSLVYPGSTTTTTQGEATDIDITVESNAINGEVNSGLGNNPTRYTIILLDGIELYLSNDHGLTAEERPDTFTDSPYVRQ